jgi:hypothetical protein
VSNSTVTFVGNREERGLMLLIPSRFTITLVIALFGVSMSCFAQDSAAVRFAQEFVGVCAHDFPAVDKIKAAAKVLNWKEITDPNIRAMMGPASPGALWQGWLVVEKEDKYFVGISEGTVSGKNINTCTVVQDRTDVDAIISELNKILNAKKIDEYEEAGQRQITSEIEIAGQRYLLMTGDGTPLKMMLITATIITDFRGFQ